jgi:hypothetical protein
MMGFEKVGRRGRMLIGYARVSTAEQSLDLQVDALKRAECRRVFTDKVSTTKADHPGVVDAVSHLRERDVLVTWKLDRLGRTVKGLVDFVADLRQRGVQFRSLFDAIDTTTSAGRFFFHIMASLAQMERELLAERTRAGLAAAAGPGRGAQATDDAGEGGIGPQAPEGWDAASGRGPEPRGLGPDALPVGPRCESMSSLGWTRRLGDAEMSSLTPDQPLLHYRILGKVGEGGMGEVYKAEDSRLGRFGAIKQLPPETAQDEKAKQRLLREARSASAFDHPQHPRHPRHQSGRGLGFHRDGVRRGRDPQGDDRPRAAGAAAAVRRRRASGRGPRRPLRPRSQRS